MMGQKWIEFPATDLDALSPIHSPQRVCTWMLVGALSQMHSVGYKIFMRWSLLMMGQKWIEFLATDLDVLSPIHTPQRVCMWVSERESDTFCCGRYAGDGQGVRGEGIKFPATGMDALSLIYTLQRVFIYIRCWVTRRASDIYLPLILSKSLSLWNTTSDEGEVWS